MAAMLSAAARAYGSLEHPRIARMSEFGVAQGATFTAVEYVLGLDALRLIGEVRLAGVTLAPGGALALVSQAARAVGYAHGRGLTHLGLAPTNVIVTADGDIKITDFGILSATLPQRPTDVSRLTQRIPYLAPEQLANEATSAATDVFALGVLAYELVTGTRTFRGETPQQVASAIMAGPPSEPPLPRPIVRVLQRCLARSPFERFPDARALADALDAALRVAPVPGTRKDVGVQVKETLDRLAALNDGQMSGMVALHLGTGPIRRISDDEARDTAPATPAQDPSALLSYELARSELPAGGPPGGGPAFGHAASTLPDLPRMPITTVPGLPPPPIPVPPGLGTSGMPPSSPQPGAHTLLGIGKPPPAIPPIKPRPNSASAITTRPPAVPPAAMRPGSRTDAPLAPVAIEPASAQAQIGAAHDATIHTLDPSDIVQLDDPLGDSADPDGFHDRTVFGSTTSADVDADLADTPAPAPFSDDFLDAPTHAISETRSGRVTVPSQPSVAPTRSPSSTSRPNAAPGSGPGSQPRLGGPGAPAKSGSQPNATSTTASPSPGSFAGTLSGAGALSGPGASSATGAPASSAGSLASSTAGAPNGLASAPGSSGAASASGRQAGAWSSPAPSDPLSGSSPRAGSGATALPGPSSDRAVTTNAAADLDNESSDEPAGPSSFGDDMDPDGGGTAIERLSGQTILGFAAPTSTRSSTPTPGPTPIVTGRDPGAIWQRPLGDTQPEDVQSPPEASAPPAPPPGWSAPPPRIASPITPLAGHARRGTNWVVIGLVGAAVVGVTAWQLSQRTSAPDAAKLAAGPGDARSSDAALIAADAGPSDATQLATLDAGVPRDAARLAAVTDAALPDATRIATATDAGAARDARLPGDATQVAGTPPVAATGDTLAIASTPAGARVFLDGADTGTTPIKLPGSPDRHTIALMLAGHELYVAQVDGHGTFQIPLKEVTPTNGPAGIKVMRCKPDRYYVFVDGKPTGQTCPTERIGCEIGPHTVEVYDVVSETRRKWDIVVKDTRLSFRVRVE
jgi:serine/threonine-protein kinase